MNKINEDNLAAILKESGIEETSGLFTQQLLEAVVTNYKEEVEPAHTAEKWLGKGIIAVVILFNLLFLFYLFTFLFQTVIFISLFAFVIGFYLVMIFIRQFEMSNYSIYSK